MPKNHAFWLMNASMASCGAIFGSRGLGVAGGGYFGWPT